MAEPFAFANDGLPLGFTLLVELIDMLDRSPVGDVPRFTLPEEAIEHAAAGKQSNVALCSGVTGRPVIFWCFRTRVPKAFCIATERCSASSISSSGSPV